MPEDPDDTFTPEDDSPVIAKLRKEAERAGMLDKENESLRRDLALSRSGLALNETQAKALGAVHEGEWTPEALTATATNLGFGAPPPATATPAPTGAPAEELAAMQRSSTAMAAPAPPQIDAEAELVAKIQAAQTPQEVADLMASVGRLHGQNT